MDNSSKGCSGTKQLGTFSCATCIVGATKISGQPASALLVTAVAVSSEVVEVSAIFEGASDVILEALRPDGTWASIGYFKDGYFFNPAVPVSYLQGVYSIHLRIRDLPSTEFIYPVSQIITSVSSVMNDDGSVFVKGATTLHKGIVEAFTVEGWKGIGRVENSEFVNPAVPQNYLTSSGTLRIRVGIDNTELRTDFIDSTLDFPHPRTVLIRPMMPAAQEQVLMSWRLQKADYQPTGYFVPAGAEVKVWVSGSVEDLTLLVGIQGIADWRDPSNSVSMRPTKLRHGENIITDAIGGAIHIRNLSEVGAARVVFSGGAIPIPYYVNGVTSAEQWVKMLKASQASQVHEVELVGEHVVIAALLETALKFTGVDPADAVDSHERVLSIEAEVAGLDGSKPEHTRSRLLIYAVESYTAYPPHATSGYIGLPHNPVVGQYSQALIGGQAANLWVTLHEYGHHHQNPTNGIPSISEMSVNIYALAVGRVFDNEYSENLPTRWPDTQKWLALPNEEKVFHEGPDPMAIYEQLRLGLGESFLPDWDRYIRENPCLLADTKRLVLSASIVANYNLALFFYAWGLLKDSDTEIWEAVADLKLEFPPVLLFNIRPYQELVEGLPAEALTPVEPQVWTDYGPKRKFAH